MIRWGRKERELLLLQLELARLETRAAALDQERFETIAREVMKHQMKIEQVKLEDVPRPKTRESEWADLARQLLDGQPRKLTPDGQPIKANKVAAAVYSYLKHHKIRGQWSVHVRTSEDGIYIWLDPKEGQK